MLPGGFYPMLALISSNYILSGHHRDRILGLSLSKTILDLHLCNALYLIHPSQNTQKQTASINRTMNQLSLPAGPARSIYPCTYPPTTSLSSTNRNPNFSYSGLPTGDADRYVSSPTSSALSNPHRSSLDASPCPAYSGLVPSISRSRQLACTFL